MPTLEERVAYLEGRVTEHSKAMDGIREALVSLEARIDARFESMDRRVERVERRLDSLDDKVSRYFVWMIGAQVTTLAAIVAALAGR